jgi:predicted ATPase
VRPIIVTGAPGAGKTTLLTELGRRGYPIVREAATDVNVAAIAAGVDQPSQTESFIDDIVRLQQQRVSSAPSGDRPQLHDRSLLCTLALARYLGRPVTDPLRQALAELEQQDLFDRRVLFVRPLGFIEPTAARRISYQHALVFEAVHVEVYTELGYQLVDLPAAELNPRVELAARLLDDVWLRS